MQSRFVLPALAAITLLGSLPVSAAVLTVQPGTTTFVGVAPSGTADVLNATYNLTLDSWVTTTSSTTISEEIAIAPTTTSPGLVKVYELKTEDKTLNETIGTRDDFFWSQPLTNNSMGAEYAIFSATVTSSLSTTLEVFSAGNYTSVASPPFGSSVPALPSYFMRLGGSGSWTSLGAYSYAQPDGTFSGDANTVFKLAANVPTMVEIAVSAGANVDLSVFQVWLMSDYYNVHDETSLLSSVTTKTLVDAHALAPVPEPESYALLLAGLLFVGLRMRSQRR